MVTKERIMEIRILRRQGYSIRWIAKELCLSRNTVRRYLRGESEGKYPQRGRLPSKLSPYKVYIANRIRQAAPHRLPATVLFREMRALGFSRSERLVRHFVSELYPLPALEPDNRFETPAGMQMQVDWCVFRRGNEPPSVFVATLGFSRFTYVEFVRNETFATCAHVMSTHLPFLAVFHVKYCMTI